MAKNRQQTDEKLQYLVTDQKGSFVLEVPATWKLTFAAVNPAVPDRGYDSPGHCLRVWEGEKLRAVFGNITGFRDLSIPMARKIQKETGSASWTKDSAGNFEHTVKARVEELTDGDDDDVFLIDDD